MDIRNANKNEFRKDNHMICLSYRTFLCCKIIVISLAFSLNAGLRAAPVVSEVESSDIVTSNLYKPIVNFQERQKLINRRCELSYVSAPNNAREQAKVSWKNLHGYLELVYSNYRSLGAQGGAPELPNFINAILTLNISSTDKEPVKKIGVMIMDAYGELFNFEKDIKIDRAGNHEISFDINTTKPLNKEEKTPENLKRFVRIKNKKIDLPARFVGIFAQCDKGSSGSLLLNNITMNITQKLVDAIRVDVLTGNPLHILKPGKEEQFKLSLSNILDKRIKVDISLKISDLDDNKISVDLGERTFNPGETKTFNLPHPAKFGIGYIDCQISVLDHINDKRIVKRSFAYMNPVGATPGEKPDGFIMGINSHPDRMPYQIDLEAEAIALIGAKILRVAIGFHDVKRVDQIIDEFSKRGVNFNLIIGGYPKLRDKNGKITEKPDYKRFKQELGKIFKRYKGKVKYWELLNEPDIARSAHPAVDEYVELTKIAKKELDEIDPSASLVSAGFCTFYHKIRGEFQKETMARCSNQFKLHCFHGHGGFKKYISHIDNRLLKMREENNITIPWYSNETALSSSGMNKKAQSVALFKKLLFAWSRKTVGYTWYCLRNKGADPLNGELNYGMFDLDFYPKAVYVAFNTIAKIYKGKKFIRQASLKNKSDWAFVFKGDNEIVIGAWTEESFEANALLAETDAKTVEIIDLMGNVKPVNKYGNNVLTPLSKDPYSLVLKGASYAKLKSEALINSMAIKTPVAGESVPFTIVAHNPLPIPLSVNIKLSVPSGLRFERDSGRIELHSNQSIKWETKLIADANYHFKSDDKISISYYLNDHRYNVYSMSVAFGETLPESIGKEAFRHLNQRDQVVSLFEADPGNIDKLWATPDDLSAKVWLSANKAAFNLKVEVKDDKHVQDYTNGEVWKGDNVQAFFSFPRQGLFWEIGFTYHENKPPETYIWSWPSNGNKALAIKDIKLKASRTGDVTTYIAEIPYRALGTNYAKLKQGFRFNIMVNDNDLGVREGWIRLAPGVGNKKEPDFFPYLTIK